MSIIQRIRDRAAWFIFGAIALSLLAFILQDALTRRGSYFSSGSSVGKVNGASIEKTDFDEKLSLYEQNGSPREQLISGIWDMMVNQTIFQQQYDKLGLQYTSKELSDDLFGNEPPQMMRQAFTDPSTGMYNGEQAKQVISQIKSKPTDPRNKQLWDGILEPSIQEGLRNKYQAMVAGGVYIPKWLAEKTNADNNSLANISYVTLSYGTISDSSVKVSDDDIAAYIKKHPKQYEIKEDSRQMEYISFDANPSAADSAGIRAQLEQLKNEFATTKDEKTFLTKNGSELPYYDSYINKSQIKQKVNDSIFSLSAGGIYGPYLDGANYAMAKLVSERQMPDSAKVRHILVATHQTDQQTGQSYAVRDDSTAKKRLDSAIAEINSGKNFDSVCLKYSEDPGSNSKGGVYNYFASGQMVEEFNDFCFTGATGEKKTVKTSYGYHYIEILGQKGSSTAYKFAYLAKPIVASQETIDALNTAATKFASESHSKKDFDSNAAKINKMPVTSNEIKENDFYVQNVGNSREIVRWLYKSDVGTISAPFTVGDKTIVAIVTGIAKKGLQAPQTARPMVEPIVRNEKKAQQLLVKFKGATLDEIAKNTGAAVLKADSVSFQAFFIPGIGNEPKILGAAFNKQLQGKASIPVAGNTGVFALSSNSVYAQASLASNPDAVKTQLTQRLKSQASDRSMNALRDAANIDDYRSTFY